MVLQGAYSLVASSATTGVVACTLRAFGGHVATATWSTSRLQSLTTPPTPLQTRGIKIIRNPRRLAFRPVVPNDDARATPPPSLAEVRYVRPVSPQLVFRERMRELRRKYRDEAMRKRAEAAAASAEAADDKKQHTETAADVERHIADYRAKRLAAEMLLVGQTPSKPSSSNSLDKSPSSSSSSSGVYSLVVDREAMAARDARRRERFERNRVRAQRGAVSALLSARNGALVEPDRFLAHDNVVDVASDLYARTMQTSRTVPTDDTANQRRTRYMQDFAQGLERGGVSLDHVYAARRRSSSEASSEFPPPSSTSS